MFRKLVSINLLAMLEMSTKSRIDRRRKRHPVLLFSLLIAVIVGALYVSYGEILYKPLLQAMAGTPLHGLYWAITALLSTMVAILVILFMTGPIVFTAKDNERLLAMPIKPISIVLARIVGLYLYAFIAIIIFFLPGLLVHIVTIGLPLRQTLMLCLTGLFLPLLPLSMALLLGFVLHLLSSRINRFKSIITMVVSLAALAGYLYLILNIQNVLTVMLERGETVQSTFRRVLPFFYHMGQAISQLDIFSLLIYLAWMVLPALFVTWLVVVSFRYVVRYVSSQGKTIFKGARATSKGVTAALIGREFWHYVSAPMVMLNTGISAVLIVAISVWLAITKDVSALFDEIPQLNSYLPGGFMVIVLFMASTAQISASSLSLEGKTIWHLKALPLRAGTILWSKVLFHWLMFGPSFLLFSLVIVIRYGNNLLSSAVFILLPQIFLLVFGQIGLLINLLMPRFDYLNETAVVKQSMSVLISMLIGFALSAAVVVIYLFVGKQTITLDQYLAFLTGVFMLIAGGLSVVINRYGVKRFAGLDIP